MNTTEIIQHARECMDTPWHHQGRLVGVGIDCVGLICHVASRLNLPYQDFTQYSRHPDPELFMQRLVASGVLEPHDKLEPGAIVVFWIRHSLEPVHIGIATGVGLIHTHGGIGRVREHPMIEFWSSRVHSVWRFIQWQR